jgi:hypothetical protein
LPQTAGDEHSSENPFSNAHEEQVAPPPDEVSAQKYADTGAEATVKDVEKAEIPVVTDSDDNAKAGPSARTVDDPSTVPETSVSSTAPTSTSTSTEVNKAAESKSIFDFVSPFDMFKSLNLGDAKKSVSNEGAVLGSHPPKQSSAPAGDNKTTSIDPAASATIQRPPPGASSAAPSESGSSKNAEVKVDSPYSVGKVVGKGKGRGSVDLHRREK